MFLRKWGGRWSRTPTALRRNTCSVTLWQPQNETLEHVRAKDSSVYTQWGCWSLSSVIPYMKTSYLLLHSKHCHRLKLSRLISNHLIMKQNDSICILPQPWGQFPPFIICILFYEWNKKELIIETVCCLKHQEECPNRPNLKRPLIAPEGCRETSKVTSNFPAASSNK